MKAEQYTNELRIEFWRILEANELKKVLRKYKGKNISTNVFLSELDRFTTTDVVLAFRRLLQSNKNDNSVICIESVLKKMIGEGLISSTNFKNI